MKDPSGSAFALPPSRHAQRIRQRKQPRQSRAQASVEAVLEATLQVLLDGGYARLTTTRVAERAGVSVGTVYQYFPDKLALVTALKVQYFELVTRRIVEVADAARALPLPGAVRSVIDALLAVKRKNLALSLALREPFAALEAQAIVRDAGASTVRAMARLVRAKAPRLARPELVARVVVTAVEGVVGAAIDEQPALLASEPFADELVALVLGYLRAAPRAGVSPRARVTRAAARPAAAAAAR